MTTVDLHAALTIALNAVQEAGEYLMNHLGHASVQYEKGPADDLLDVDLGAERILLHHLRPAFPGVGVLSEEAGRLGDEDDYWIIDPLDGSSNFQQGSPLFCTAIALKLGGQTALGVIAVHGHRETFSAVKGGGAFCNGEPIAVSSVTTLDHGIVHHGGFARSAPPALNQQRGEELIRIARHARQIRITGTSALDLVYVACGRALATVNHARSSWDIDGGQLIIEEAGGRVTETTYPDGSLTRLYTNGHVHDELAAALQQA